MKTRLFCWEGHSTLCYTAHGWKGKSDLEHPGVKPLDLRSGPCWTNRTNKGKPPVCRQSSVSVVAAYLNS